MIIILGTIKVASVEEAARVRAALVARAVRSRADAGNIDYVFTANLEDPTEFRLVETWSSAELLEAHLRIPDPAFGELITTARIERAHVVAYDGTNERVLMTR